MVLSRPVARSLSVVLSRGLATLTISGALRRNGYRSGRMVLSSYVATLRRCGALTFSGYGQFGGAMARFDELQERQDGTIFLSA